MKRWVVFCLVCMMSLTLFACSSDGDDLTDGDVDGDNDCTGDSMELCNGECVNTSNNATNCGGCNNVCPGGTSCIDGVCTCSDGLELCAAECVDTSSNMEHCGGCNNSCSGDTSCVEGVCRCADGSTACGDDCVDTDSNNNHCGACDNACQGNTSCVDGACRCADGSTACGDDCVDTDSDRNHCGGCNNVCPEATTCVDGECTCSGGLTLCGTECVNTDTDPENCGACSAPCREGLICWEGVCVAAVDETCDGEDNDLDGLTDEDASGAPLARSCDNLCGPGTETCEGGTYTGCTAPIPVDETCNGEDDNCDGLTDEGVTTTYYEDYDLDGFGDPDLAYSTEACSLPEEPSPNGGVYVEDNTDCNDVDDEVYPGHAEDCDEKDNNCNDDIDEGCACSPLGGIRECGSDEGICVAGTQQCTDEGWSECGGDDYVPPAATETCNDLDDDCDGETDEELADDLYEINDSCTTARNLPDVHEFADEPVSVNNLTIYHGSSEMQDSDWFIVRAVEGDHFFSCIEYFLQTQCNFLFSAKLKVPSDEVADNYVLCVHSGDCPDFDASFCTDEEGMDYDPETGEYSMVLSWDGTCGIDDSWVFYVEVKSGDFAVNSCQPYEIEFEMAWTGEAGDQCE